MTLTVKHSFVSAIADDPAALAAGEVVPQAHWNAAHTISGTPDATSALPFMSDGAANPWGVSVPSKNAFYASSTDTTWFAWEAWSPTLAKRVIEVATYSPASGWSQPVVAGTVTLTNDSHGSPDIVRDPTRGHVYLFYGAHEGNIQYSYTTNADDPSAWTTGSLAAGTYGNFTFPSAFVVGSTLYLFYSTTGSGGGLQASVSVTTAAIASDGSLTWSGTKKSLLDTGGTSWFFPGQYVLHSGKVYFVGNYSASFATFPVSNVYLMVYDPATGNLTNYDASVTVLPASQPINKATMDTSFKAVTDATIQDAANFGFDTTGTVHLVYNDKPASTTLMKYTNNSGSGWAASTTIVTAPGSNYLSDGAVVPLSAGAIDVYYADGKSGSTSYAAGAGDIYKINRTSGGTWGTASLIARQGFYGLDSATVVNDASSVARVTFTEVSRDGLAVVATLRGFAYGDNGFLAQANEMVPNNASPLIGFTQTLGDTSWAVPEAIYVNGNDPSPYGNQALFQYDNNGVMRSVLYSDGSQYWACFSGGTQVGQIGFTAPGGFPGMAIFGVVNGRCQWAFNEATGSTHWGTKTGSGSPEKMLSLLASDKVQVQADGMFGWSSDATDSSVAADTALARNGARVVEINNGTAGTFGDLQLRSLFSTNGATVDAGSGSASATITLVGRNVGVANSASVFADQNGSLNFQTGSLGQVFLTSAATGSTQFLLSNTSTGGLSYSIASSGSSFAFGAGDLYAQLQSGSFVVPFRYSGPTANQWIFNSTEPVCWGNDLFTSSPDTGISRSSAGIIAFGNGTQGDATAALRAASATFTGIAKSVGLISNSAAVATNATDGFLYVTTSAGAPTGTPTTQTGTAALEYDTTNNNLEIYNAGWNVVGPMVNTAPAGSVNIPANYSLIVAQQIAVAASQALTLGAGATLRII